jgi:uncharacterized protein (DUF2141 family)
MRLALAAAAVLLVAAAPPAQAPTTITVDMSAFRNDKGAALVALYASSAGFPDHPDKAVQWLQAPIKDKHARAVFKNVRAGTYAVAVLHDEDGDHKMKTGIFGQPKEGYGCSRDARGHFGPPHFDAAKFAVATGKAVLVPVKMTY